MTRKTHYLKLLLLFSFLNASIAVAGDCDLAKSYFDKGLAAGKQADWNQAHTWLKKSVQECNQFDNWYLLGQVEQELENFTAAAATFEEARKHAADDDQVALAVARYAEVLSAQGKLSEPLALLHQARKLHAAPPQWMEDLAMHLDKERMRRPLTVSQVTRGLKNRAITLLGGNNRSSVNISINFEYNSVDVTQDSLENIDVLAKALADGDVKNDQVMLVGHTDVRGEDNYNLTLSQQRAQHVAQMLMERNPELQTRLNIEGAGESEPLYNGDDEEVHQLNRRIEVFLIAGQ